MATHSSILAWRIPWVEEPGGLQSTGSQRVRTGLSDFTFTIFLTGQNIMLSESLFSLSKLHSQHHREHLVLIIPVVTFAVVQLLSCVQLFSSPWTAAHQASLSFSISLSLLKLMSVESVMPSNHLILCHPLLLLLSILPSIKVFSSESPVCIRWSKYCSFSFSIGPSSEYSGLIFFRIDWFHLIAFQRTLKSLLQLTT